MKRAILIAGPTASGKSALSLKLAEELNGVIINADSMQVYRDLRIITARPSVEDEQAAPHRLYGFMDATEVCSAALWASLAMQEIEAAWQKDQVPILVGGTGMYFKVLIDGIAVVPDIPDDIRSTVRARCDSESSEVLHAELMQVDPEMAGRLAPGDSQRISRALEVYLATGTPLSVWQKDTKPGPLAALDQSGGTTKLVLAPERQYLYDRCNLRFDLMMQQGALEEVLALKARNLDSSLPLMRSLGVPSLLAYLNGEIELETALEDAKMQTRRFAKRQLTWFRNQFGHWDRVQGQADEALALMQGN